MTNAFELFSQETKRLEAAYSDLKAQFKDVNVELEETNRKLNNKIFEFHIMMNYLTNILQNMSQGILFIGLNGIITTYNHTAEKFLKHESEKVLFNNFWEVFPDDFFGFSMKEALASPQISLEPKNITLATEDITTQRDLEITASFVLENKNPSTPADLLDVDFTKGMIILIRDLTEIRRLQLVANRNDRMKELGEMAAMVAHEIRNPLGGIKGFASLFSKRFKRSTPSATNGNLYR